MWFKHFLLFCIILVGLHPIKAQGQEKRILIIPFSEVNFELPASRVIVAGRNQVEPQELHGHYLDSLLFFLSKNENNLLFYRLPVYEDRILKQQMPIAFKRKPTSHMGTDIESLVENGKWQAMMENMGVDLVVVLTHYRMAEYLLPTKQEFDGSKFLSWTKHYVDYEVYDRQGEMIAMADDFTMKAAGPRKDNFQSQGTLVSDMKYGYRKLAEDIALKIEKHEKSGKIVHTIR
jgi:hypothetical protein